MQSKLFLALTLSALALARTDIAGCTSTATTDQYHEASMLYYVPGTGEICSFLDCGGGRAPPKTDVPGCPLYSGTASVTPSFLPGYGAGASATATTTSSVVAASTSSAVGGVTTSAVAVTSSAAVTSAPVTSTIATVVATTGFNTTVVSFTAGTNNSSVPYPTKPASGSGSGSGYGAGSGGNSTAPSSSPVVPANPNGAGEMRPVAVMGGLVGAVVVAAALL